MTDDATNERWRRAPAPHSNYLVSDQGRVRRGRRVLKPDGSSYPRVSLCSGGVKKTKPVHRLVAETFLGSCPDGHEVNHRNGVKTDNRVSNLEYVTRAVNVAHARAQLGRKRAGPRGTRAANSKLTPAAVEEIRASKLGPAALGRRFGVAESTIRSVLTRDTWDHVA